MGSSNQHVVLGRADLTTLMSVDNEQLSLAGSICVIWYISLWTLTENDMYNGGCKAFLIFSVESTYQRAGSSSPPGPWFLRRPCR